MKIQPIIRHQSAEQKKQRPNLFKHQPQTFKSPLGVLATAAAMGAMGWCVSCESESKFNSERR